MTPEEREAIDGRLEAYDGQLAEASVQSEYGSLERAADLAARFKDKSWVDEIDPAKPDALGKVTATSQRQFAKWLTEKRGWRQVGLRARQLIRGHEFARGYSVSTGGFTGEGALRPLYRLERGGFEGHVDEVVARVRELAGSKPITSEHTARAVREFLAKQPKKEVKRQAARSKVVQRMERVRYFVDEVYDLGGYKELADLHRELGTRLRALQDRQAGAA